MTRPSEEQQQQPPPTVKVETPDVEENSSHQPNAGQQHQSHQFRASDQYQHQQIKEEERRQQAYANEKQQQSDDSNGASNKPKRNPFCSRCRNHGKSAQVKGHKRHCEYRDCQCEGCKLVECRQIVSAAQIKRRRYQKQDEECGRRIEISPPVLKREPASDPAALIAKTLIGATKVVSVAPPPPPPLTTGAGQPRDQPPHNHHHHHHHHAANNNSGQPNGGSAQHQKGLQHLGNLVAMVGDHAHHPLQQHQHHQHQQQHLQLGGGGPPTLGPSPLGQLGAHPNSHDLASSAALINALHLFQLPGPMQPHLNPPPPPPQQQQQPAQLQQQQQQAGGPLPALLAPPSCAMNQQQHPGHQHHQAAIGLLLPPPSFREQIQLVEEIHELYGPLAVYAWLRNEQFNLGKVRDLIELSRSSFDELLQLTGHSPLDLTSPVVD